MAQSGVISESVPRSGTLRASASWFSAILLAAIFLLAGLWKLTDPRGAGVRLAEARVPESLSVAAAVGFGILETFAGLLLLRPRWRRWGAALSGFLLLAFMVFIALHYHELRGQECNCFPWIKRAVGPGFFLGDGIMLALAFIAGAVSRASSGYRGASAVFAGVCLFAVASFGIGAEMHRGTAAPPSISAQNGQTISLQSGKILIFFFNPQCLHCLDAGKKLAALNWTGGTRFIGVPTENPQFGSWFMGKAGLKDLGPVSADLDPLRKTFPFPVPPAAVALENGREKAMLLQFEGNEPVHTLKQLGFIR
jgi:uncharacterized membrane protein YphA (DoxX/SURF4 family)